MNKAVAYRKMKVDGVEEDWQKPVFYSRFFIVMLANLYSQDFGM